MDRSGITLYVENAPKRLRQMFADIAEAKPIDRATKVRFNTSDPFNNIAQAVEGESQLVKEKVNTNQTATKIGKDEFLMTSLELKDIVNVLTTGKTIGKPTGQMRMDTAPRKKKKSPSNSPSDS